MDDLSPLTSHLLPLTSLKWQIVSRTLTCRFLSRRERSSLRSRLLRRERSSAAHRSATHRSSHRCSTTHHTVGTNIIKPTAVELVCINIEAHGDILTLLNIELLDTVFAKNTEHALARILPGNFYHIVLRHP